MQTRSPILSEAEVGALFEAVRQASGSLGDTPAPEPAGGEAGEPRPFLPRALERTGDGLLGLVERVHRELAVQGTSSLSALLRMPASLQIGTAVATRHADLPLTGSEGRLTLHAKGRGPVAQLLLDEAMVRASADRLLGGPGLPSAPNRPVSALEKRIAERPVQALGEALRDAWSPWLGAPLEVALRLEPAEGELRGPLLAASAVIRLGTLDIAGVLVYPQEALNGALDCPDDSAPAGRSNLAGRLATLPLEVAFQAPDFVLSVGELLGLKPGTTLGLGHCSDLRVELAAEGTPLHRGRLLVDSASNRTVAIEESLFRTQAGPPAAPQFPRR